MENTFRTCNPERVQAISRSMDFLREREELVNTAKAAEQAEQYDEMVEAIKKIADVDVELTIEERSMFYAGCKNVVCPLRASLKILSSIESHISEDEEIYMKRHKVESQLSNFCTDIISVIDDHLLPSSSVPESSVFYHKMKGDYYRYLAEFKNGDEKEEASEQSKTAYETATIAAEAELSPTHPIRLSVALNFSVFCYEIINNRERACHVAKIALDEAIALDSSRNEESCRDCAKIIQLLKDSLSLWNTQRNL